MVDKLVDDLVVKLGPKDLYLCAMYDDIYKIYIFEILNKYGEVENAGMGKSLEEGLEDLKRFMDYE